jgi:hypothetical protein
LLLVKLALFVWYRLVRHSCTSKDDERLCATSEVWIWVARGRLILRRLARMYGFSDGLSARSALAYHPLATQGQTPAVQTRKGCE